MAQGTTSSLETTTAIVEERDRASDLNDDRIFVILHRSGDGSAWATFGAGSGLAPTTIGPCANRQELLDAISERYRALQGVASASRPVCPEQACAALLDVLWDEGLINVHPQRWNALIADALVRAEVDRG